MTYLINQPWDEIPMRRDLVEALEQLPRRRLDRLDDLPSGPGCYLQWIVTPSVAPVLGTVVSSGRYPAYVGVAAVSLRERIGRYRQSLRGISAIPEAAIYVGVLACDSSASALFAERAAIDALVPPLQGTGWGSKVPGGNRREQGSIDALFEGRSWASPPSLAAQAIARLQVLSRLINLDPYGPRWPPILSAASVQPLANRSR